MTKVETQGNGKMKTKSTDKVAKKVKTDAANKTELKVEIEVNGNKAE
ncbi:hypothetical protein BSPWISOXPB_10967 [uncultured Gammaproteobacteria bacterium]|nr:hypothetical protein BSPWISOXPB_10967 [uncultured Gammaproteobacteria bacterium]